MLRAEYQRARSASSAAIARVVHNTPLELQRVRDSMEAKSLAVLKPGVLCVGPRAVEIVASARSSLGVPVWGVLSVEEARALWPQQTPSVCVIDTDAVEARDVLLAMPQLVRVILWGDATMVRAKAISVPSSTGTAAIVSRCYDALQDVAAAQRP